MSKNIELNTHSSCFSSDEHSCMHSKWFAVAVLVSNLVIFGVAAFGGVGLFAPHSILPQWLSHAFETIGYSGSLTLFVAGSVLGIVGDIILMAAANCKNNTTIRSQTLSPSSDIQIIPLKTKSTEQDEQEKKIKQNHDENIKRAQEKLTSQFLALQESVEFLSRLSENNDTVGWSFKIRRYTINRIERDR